MSCMAASLAVGSISMSLASHIPLFSLLLILHLNLLLLLIVFAHNTHLNSIVPIIIGRRVTSGIVATILAIFGIDPLICTLRWLS